MNLKPLCHSASVRSPRTAASATFALNWDKREEELNLFKIVFLFIGLGGYILSKC
jgi:hypothetical protein